MSWMQKLYETYDNCQAKIGVIEKENKVPLLPPCHTTQQAHITITLDANGTFQRASVVPKHDAMTIIPCTEKSGGRTRGVEPHPLADKLEYVTNDYVRFGGNKAYSFQQYIGCLEAWCHSSFAHPKARVVLAYAKDGHIIADLVKEHILFLGPNGKLLVHRDGQNSSGSCDIFDTLPGQTDAKGRPTRWQADAFIRWEVELPNDYCPKTWEDRCLWQAWTDYYTSTQSIKSLCFVSGKELFVASMHPAKLRNSGDKAKLISSNDSDNFTFRGRFETAEQVCSVSSEVTHKAHSALRWLISRQGYTNGDLAIVAWSQSGVDVPDPLKDPLGILGDDSANGEIVYTAQDLAEKLKKKIRGYACELGPTNTVLVMGLNSASPGRLSVIFYRELSGSDFLMRLESWHSTCSWIHDYGNSKGRQCGRFVGAPAANDIAEIIYGKRVEATSKNKLTERLLPCIIDGQNIPKDIVDFAFRRACNRVSFKSDSDWNKTLSICCALFRKLNYKEGYDMALDPNRTSRDYLYGRLLAIADNLENWALKTANETRPTHAARLMQRFAEHPFTTWQTIKLALVPYEARLGNRAYKLQELLEQVHGLFLPEDFVNDRKLTGEFLLGYYCQREAIKHENSKDVPVSSPEMSNCTKI